MFLTSVWPSSPSPFSQSGRRGAGSVSKSLSQLGRGIYGEGAGHGKAQPSSPSPFSLMEKGSRKCFKVPLPAWERDLGRGRRPWQSSALIPQPLLPNGEGEPEVLQSPSPSLGEGFRERAQAMVKEPRHGWGVGWPWGGALRPRKGVPPGRRMVCRECTRRAEALIC
jgi:hypothetical protein